MARILYAASGDGYGHATRAHSVGLGLLGRGHDVQFLTSHKSIRYLRSVFPDRTHDVFGLRTVYEQGRADVFRTVLHNLTRAVEALGPSNLAVRRLLRDHRPDLVITDFEPFSAFWARRYGIPYVSLDNQHLLTHCTLDHPRGFRFDQMSAYLTIRLYYAGARRYLITTFIDAPVRYHPTRLVSPVLRPSVYDKRPTDGGFLLAYKGAGGRNDAMRDALETFDRMSIRAYGLGRNGSKRHITFRPTDPDAFLDDLASCSGVIATAGHSLVCECLFLEKPMLVLPVRKQYEQIINAHYVEKLGFGRAVTRLQPEIIDEFVSQLDAYRAPLAAQPKRAIGAVLDAVEQEIF